MTNEHRIQQLAKGNHAAPTRRSFLTRAAGVSALTLPALTLFTSKARAEDDAEIARDFQDIRRHENDHVAFLVKALGDSARPKPNF